MKKMCTLVSTIIWKNPIFGFRQLFDTVESLLEKIGKLKLNAEMFLDLKYVFGTIDHICLLDKLNSFSVRGTSNDWFRCSLINSKQCVYASLVFSNSSYTSHDVPQGSVIGPFLFLD